jgi:ABC-type multidrug transport system fused ATPase/permease subunit
MNLSRILCTFSGDDYSIISQSDRTIQNRFKAIGGFVTAIFALCFISCYFTFTKLFQNYFIGIPIGIFFSYMITNIYLLLLYTLSKNSFPCKTDKAAQLFSIAIRVVFICFIAIIVSKPIETIVFAIPLENEITEYKQQQIHKYSQTTHKYFDEEIRKLKLEITEHEKIADYTKSTQLENYKTRLQKKVLQKDELIASMIHLVSKSNYYIQSIVILNTKYRTCWLITLFTMFIFLFPAYLKNFLGEQSVYYKTKRTIENRLVKEEYDVFKKRYKELFISKIISEMQYPKQDDKKGILKEMVNIHNSMIRNIQFSESFIDAPFNTIRKRDEREFLKEDDLISDLYDV